MLHGTKTLYYYYLHNNNRTKGVDTIKAKTIVELETKVEDAEDNPINAGTVILLLLSAALFCVLLVWIFK